MKRIFFCTLAALTALALLASGASAAKAWDYWIVATGDCHLRAGANLNADVITVIQKGHDAEFLGELGLDSRGVVWYYVDAGKYEGWVSSKYAQLTGENDLTFDGGDSYELPSAELVSATGGDSNIRSMPDRGAPVVGLLRRGENAIYAGLSYDDYRGVRWDYVEFEDGDGYGASGWISSKYTTAKGGS